LSYGEDFAHPIRPNLSHPLYARGRERAGRNARTAANRDADACGVATSCACGVAEEMPAKAQRLQETQEKEKQKQEKPDGERFAAADANIRGPRPGDIAADKDAASRALAAAGWSGHAGRAVTVAVVTRPRRFFRISRTAERRPL
jgi:hypothetical protein